MDAARHRQVRALLHAVAQRAEPERAAFLEREAGDPSIAAEVLALLAADPVATRDLAPAAMPAPTAPFDLPPGTTLGRHRLRAEIGRGGMGVVYEADDPEHGLVAVKVILPALLAVPSAHERFRREARLGLAIDHDHVVRTLATGEATVAGQVLHYLVMERVHGRTLRRLLDEMGSVPEALWREIALQAARGLGALHAAGVVHRDLKPENLLLADDRRVRIMDLGVAKVAAAGPSLTLEGQFVGSMRYASPEQCEGGTVGPESDLYSLGTVLYELAAGRAPFDSPDPLAVLRAQVEAAPVPLVERNGGYSDFAGEVVAALLEKSPPRRFASADALARAIEEGESGAWWAERRGAVRRAAVRRPVATSSLPLVGRGRERDALLSAWRAARRGEGAVVWVEGEAGLGKTRLVEEVLASLRDEGAEVLRSGFSPAEDLERPADAVAARLATTGLEDELARRLSLDRETAAGLAAWLERRAPPGRTLSPSAADVFLARLARSISETAPLLWVVEDLHFADADARRTVVALARAASSRRFLLLLTARPGADAALVGALGALPGFSRMDLARLDEDGVRALATEALGDGGIGRLVAPTLWQRSDGIPYFVLELLRELERSGRLVRDAVGVPKEVDLSGVELASPRGLVDLVRSRLASLAPDERTVLDAAAVEGFEFDPHLVAHALGRPALAVLEVLGRLERRDGLVRSGARLCRFDHHLLQEVAYADLPAALRAELHTRLAAATEALHPGDAAQSDRSVRVVSHRLRGAQPGADIPAAFDAIRWCESTGRYDQAFQIARRALEATRGRTDRPRLGLLLKVANLSTVVGRAADGTPVLEEALTIAAAMDEPGLVARVRLQRASTHLRAARYAEAIEDADAARADARDPESLFDSVSVRGLALWSLGRHEEAIEVHREGLVIAAGAASPGLRGRAASDLGIVFQEMGFHAEAETHLRAAAETLEGAKEPRNLATVLSNLGNAVAALGRRAEAIACYERALALARAQGQRPVESVAWVNIGAARLAVGDLSGAREALRLSEELSQEVGEPRVVTYALHRLGLVARAAGDPVEARRRLTEALALRRRLGLRSAVAETLLALGSLDREEAASDDARVRLSEAAEIGGAVGDPAVAALARLHLAFLPGGDADAARAAFAAARPRSSADARLEGLWLLWRLDGRPEDLAEAKALVDDLCRLAPARSAAAMLERVPLVRAVSDAFAAR